MAKTETITNGATGTTASAATVLWRMAVCEYEQANSQFDQNWSAYQDAEATVANSAAGMRKRELESIYGLRSNMSSDAALFAVDEAIAERDGTKSVEQPDEAVDAQAAEAERIVGEYNGLQFVIGKLREEARVGELHGEHFRYASDVFHPVREKLLATPVPDTAALLYKARVLAIAVDEAEGLAADLERLFGGK